MVAFRYRWLAAFLPFIDIKKQKALLAILCLRNFPNEKNKHTIDQSSSPSNQPAGTFIFKLCGIIEVSTRRLFYKTRATLTINRRRYRDDYFVAP